MAAGKYNILIQQGSDYIQKITVKESVSQLAVDITGCTIRGQVRVNIEDTTPAASFVAVLTDPTNGEFQISLSNTVTAALDFETGYYDVEIVYPSGVVDRLLQGKAVLSKEVTR